MSVEHDGEGLHPCEIASPAFRSSSDEVCINLEVVIGDNSEVSSLCAMEVEHHSVTTNEARIVAEGAISIAVWSSKLASNFTFATAVDEASLLLLVLHGLPHLALIWTHKRLALAGPPCLAESSFIS